LAADPVVHRLARAFAFLRINPSDGLAALIEWSADHETGFRGLESRRARRGTPLGALWRGYFGSRCPLRPSI